MLQDERINEVNHYVMQNKRSEKQNNGGENMHCKRCGKRMHEGEGVNGLCDECLTACSGSNEEYLITSEKILDIASIVILFLPTLMYALIMESLIGTILTFLISIVQVALLRVIIEVSKNVREIVNFLKTNK